MTVAIALLIAGLVGMGGSIAVLRADLREVRGDLLASQTDHQACAGKIERQNAALGALQAQSQAIEVRAREAVIAARARQAERRLAVPAGNGAEAMNRFLAVEFAE